MEAKGLIRLIYFTAIARDEAGIKIKPVVYERPNIGEEYPTTIEEFYEGKFVTLSSLLKEAGTLPLLREPVVMSVARWPMLNLSEDPRGKSYASLESIQSITVVISAERGIEGKRVDLGLVARIQTFPRRYSDEITRGDIPQLFADKVVVFTPPKLNQSLDEYLLGKGWNKYDMR